MINEYDYESFDAVVEAKGGLPEVAYTKDEGDEVTMKDAIRQADRENALRLAARRELQREKLEREKERRARFEKPENKVEGEAKKEEAPKDKNYRREPKDPNSVLGRGIKEEPIKILIVIASKIRLMYQVKVLSEKGFTVNDIANKLETKSYPVQLDGIDDKK